jgi:hypothetical protein
MNKRLLKWLATALILSTTSLMNVAYAGLISLSYSGTNATGKIYDISGTESTFSGTTYELTYLIDDALASDSAIIGTSLTLNGVLYEMTGDSAAAKLILRANSENDSISTNPTSGGHVSFLVNAGDLYPDLMTDITDLTTFNLGTSYVNSTTDSYNNSSLLSFQGDNPFTSSSCAPFCSNSALHFLDGAISIYANGGRGTSDMNLAVSEASAVPEPSSIAIFALGLIGLASRRFKKKV